MRTIKEIHDSHYAPIGNLITFSPLPSDSINHLDPFIFLNHHGPQKYAPGNTGLPFGPHPHGGMETVTFIIDGDIMHKDTGGHESIINSGGIQWMTAGKGLIHAEVSSNTFKETGGDLEILQLWLNLPSKHKMAEPYYLGLQKEDIPLVEQDDRKVKIQVVSGNEWGTKGPFNSLTDVKLSTIYFDEEGSLELKIPKEDNIFLYIVRGQTKINNKEVDWRQLVEFENDEELLTFKSLSKSIVILGHARPFNEPIVARGPFVMNSEEEIFQAYDDYRKGKFGTWR